MEYLKSGLKSVLGTPQPGDTRSGAETVDRLVERVQTSTLLDDRRDACRALKAMSRKHRVEVGARGMDALRNVLETDTADCEIVGYALDTICNICSPHVFEEEDTSEHPHESLIHVGEQFTEMFLKQSENVGIILGFLEEYDFKVRWPALRLLAVLTTNRLRDIQEIILVSPMGVSKLMDLLSDTREVIRNDTLLLLTELTKGNANIQKIVAFENAFDRLFDVITEEGYSDGGIVVQDCLLLMLNLLRNNTSNQNFFKEGSFIQRLFPLFDVPQDAEDTSWSPQKVSNIHCVIKVVRCLVSPGNPNQVTSACQIALRATGIVQALCSILMASGVPVEVLSEAICAVGETIRGNTTNQDFLNNYLAPCSPPREAIVILLMSMINEKQSFSLRCAVLYCFQCFLFKNEVGQAQLVQTLLPSSVEVSSVTSGQLLCSGLFSHDPLSNWFSAVALSHALIENPAQKEQLLRVLLAAQPDSQPVTLLHQVSMLLQQCAKVQSKLGLLMLLSTWLSHCPLAVKHFLNIPIGIPYLTAQAGSTERDDNEELVQGLCAFLMGICLLFNDDSVSAYTKENLRHLVAKRIGLEMFLSKLNEVSRHEQYSKASKQPQPRNNHPFELFLDHEFCKLFKVLEGMIIKTVAGTADDRGMLNDAEQSDGVVSHYKELIREQDKRLAESEAARASLEAHREHLEARLQEIATRLSLVTDENMLLKAQLNTVGGGEGQTSLLPEIERLRTESSTKDSTIKVLEDQVQRLHLQAEAGQTSLGREHQLQAQVTYLQSQVNKLSSDLEDNLELLADQDRRLTIYRERLKALGEKVSEDEDVAPDAQSPVDH